MVACKQRPPLTSGSCDPVVSCGISTPLGVLSPSQRQVAHALLTRSPLYSRSCPLFRVRLACLIHAASVRSEPGSNSPWSKNLGTRSVPVFSSHEYAGPRPKAQTQRRLTLQNTYAIQFSKIGPPAKSAAKEQSIRSRSPRSRRICCRHQNS